MHIKYFRYIEPRDPTNDDFSSEIVTLSEQEILDTYWDYWYSKVCEKFGKSEYSTKSCIKDWCAAHRAWRVENHQGER